MAEQQRGEAPLRGYAAVSARLAVLFRLSGGLAALFMVAIAVAVLLQVGANIVDALAARLTGAPVGLLVPSYAEFAGYFLLAATFLALAYTLRARGHIRVTLAIQGIHGRARRWVEIWCAGVGALLSAYLTWFVIEKTLRSIRYGDVSPGLVRIPDWIPQAAMCVGLVLLTLALIDHLLMAATGHDPDDTAPDVLE